MIDAEREHSTYGGCGEPAPDDVKAETEPERNEQPGREDERIYGTGRDFRIEDPLGDIRAGCIVLMGTHEKLTVDVERALEHFPPFNQVVASQNASDFEQEQGQRKGGREEAA